MRERLEQVDVNSEMLKDLSVEKKADSVKRLCQRLFHSEIIPPSRLHRL